MSPDDIGIIQTILRVNSCSDTMGGVTKIHKVLYVSRYHIIHRNSIIFCTEEGIGYRKILNSSSLYVIDNTI